METTKANRSRNLTVRFTQAEYHTLHERFQNTTCRKLSDYIRKLLFAKPITNYTRDKSMDDLARELMGLKNELHRIGNNYNQVVQKMHILRSVESLREWLQVHEKSEGLLSRQMTSIQSFIQKAGEQWLR